MTKQDIGKVKSIEITEEMRKSYLDYAMSVIVSRALPDVRDGLKPVHRRILFAMHQMGISHSSRYTKSAKVVGETMGKYHPHGDQAIYDALVRLAQDFSMRYPLIDGQGNFGSIDGDSAAAMRYCLTGDTLILTNKGIIPIEKISNKKEAKINLKVINYQGKKVKANRFFDSGKHPITKITTKQGYELKGSFNHPILCWGLNDFGFPNLQWKLLQEITLNDYVIINRNFSFFNKDNLNLKNFYPQNPSKYKDIKLPNKMNENLAFLLGALVSEGSFHQKQIIFNNQNLEFYTKVKKIIKNQFPGINLYERKVKGNCQELSLYHQKAVKLLENIGLENVKSDKKEIPFAVLYSKKEVIKQFLVALFEGDGSVGLHKDKRHQGKSTELNYNSKSFKLIKQLKTLLLNFGIVTTTPYQDKRNNCYKLIISGKENIQRFKKEVGFFSSRKKTVLNQISDINPERMSKTDWIPFLNNYLRTNYNDEFVKKNNFDRYNKLEKNYPRLKKILNYQDKTLIEWLLKKRFFFDQIKTIEKLSKKENVYSIRVADQSHSFIANGFVNHNTEVKLDKITQEILTDIEKETVEFRENFDATLKEPIYLPSRIPNLLLMGSDGIAVGMATKIPPHNLGEVVDALIVMIDKGKVILPEEENGDGKKDKDFEIKKIKLDQEDKNEQLLSLSFESKATIEEDLIKHIKGPDFPTGGTIYDRNEILQAYNTGKGKILIRAKAEIEEMKGEKFRIVISEIPYQVNKSRLLVKIAQLIRDKKINGVSDLRDESDREGLRVVLELKKTSRPKTILNNLYKNTQMQINYPANMVALINGVPSTLNLKQILTEFVKHRQKVIIKKTIFELEGAKRHAHILEGLKIALDNLDEVIETIKKSSDVQNAKDNLIRKFKLSDVQAQAILDMQLRRLAALERKKIEDEYKKVLKLIEYLKGLLAVPKKILNIVKKDLLEIKEKYADPRRTKVYVQALDSFEEEDLVPQEECLITMTKSGYIKRLPLATYRSQRRGGKGISGMKTKMEDEISYFIKAQTHDSILFFTNTGRVFPIRVWEIPEGSRQSKGQAVINLINISQDEQIKSILTLDSNAIKNRDQFLIMATKRGMIKKTHFKNFANMRSTGLIAIKLKKDDELCWVKSVKKDDHVLLASHKGKSIRFKETNIRPTGRNTMGVRGIHLKEKDNYVVCMEVFSPKQPQIKDKRKKIFRDLLIVMEKGLGKRTSLRAYRLQKRGGIGTKAAHLAEKTGDIVTCRLIDQNIKQVMLTSSKAQVIKLPIKNIPRLGRDTQGVIFMRFNKPNDKIAAVTCLEK